MKGKYTIAKVHTDRGTESQKRELKAFLVEACCAATGTYGISKERGERRKFDYVMKDIFNRRARNFHNEEHRGGGSIAARMMIVKNRIYRCLEKKELKQILGIEDCNPRFSDLIEELIRAVEEKA